jgi:hypothetical protein
VFKLYEEYNIEPPDETIDLLDGSEKIRDIVCSDPQFWIDLEEHEEIVKLFKKYSDRAFIASSPMIQVAATPKLQWIESHLGEDVLKNTVLLYSKEILAAPNRILIDDDAKNCSDFCDKGGSSILVYRRRSFRNIGPEDTMNEMVLKVQAKDLAKALETIIDNRDA